MKNSWHAPQNFLSINDVNSSLASLWRRVYEVQRQRVHFEAKVKVPSSSECRWLCEVTHVSVILSEVTHVTPFLAAPEFYVDTFNDGSVAGVPISMSLTLAFYLTTLPTPPSQSTETIQHPQYCGFRLKAICPHPPSLATHHPPQHHQYHPPTLNHPNRAKTAKYPHTKIVAVTL